jgi:putative ATPase
MGFVSLFQPIPNAGTADRATPLADRMRPRTLEEYVGQEHLLGPGKPLRAQIERDDTGSILFWGPPGTGKTTLAKIIASMTKAEFIEFSAVLAGIKEIKQVMADAERARQYGTRTIVFIDEIHRFNKAQQDAFLPHVEKGNIRLIGATTENPSFEINSALLSRCRVYVLKPLAEEQIVELLRRALADEVRGLGSMKLTASDDALKKIAGYTSGDARSAYNVLEVAAALAKSRFWQRGSPLLAKDARNGAPTDGAPADGGPVGRAPEITDDIVRDALQKRILLYDKSGEEHYNLISALHKSVRNSDPDAALYWLARMLEAGEDPLYVARRWCAWLWKISGLPTLTRSRCAWRLAMPSTLSGCRRAIWRWRKPSSIFLWRLSRTHSIPLTATCSGMWSKPPLIRCRCTCVTLPRA